MSKPKSDQRDAATSKALRSIVDDLTARTGSELAAIRLINEEMDRIEQEAVNDARSQGTTWQQVADELHLASRAWALMKFSADKRVSLPGMSAAAMARRLGIHPQTVANNPATHGVVVKTYPAKAGGRARKRYFLPGDEGSGTSTD